MSLPLESAEEEEDLVGAIIADLDLDPPMDDEDDTGGNGAGAESTPELLTDNETGDVDDGHEADVETRVSSASGGSSSDPRTEDERPAAEVAKEVLIDSEDRRSTESSLGLPKAVRLLSSVDFRTLDRDDDMQLTLEEFASSLAELGLSEGWIARTLFHLIDTDRSGTLTPKEFFSWKSRTSDESLKRFLQQGFDGTLFEELPSSVDVDSPTVPPVELESPSSPEPTASLPLRKGGYSKLHSDSNMDRKGVLSSQQSGSTIASRTFSRTASTTRATDSTAEPSETDAGDSTPGSKPSKKESSRDVVSQRRKKTIELQGLAAAADGLFSDVGMEDEQIKSQRSTVSVMMSKMPSELNVDSKKDRTSVTVKSHSHESSSSDIGTDDEALPLNNDGSTTMNDAKFGTTLYNKSELNEESFELPPSRMSQAQKEESQGLNIADSIIDEVPADSDGVSTQKLKDGELGPKKVTGPGNSQLDRTESGRGFRQISSAIGKRMSARERTYSQDFDMFSDYERKEYSCALVNTPVRNTVFMEKETEEISSDEVMFEFKRLVCTLHFLNKEFNVFETLVDYLAHQANSLNHDWREFVQPSRAKYRKQLMKAPTLYAEDSDAKKSAESYTKHIQFLFKKFLEGKQINSHRRNATDTRATPKFGKLISNKLHAQGVYDWHAELLVKFIDEEEERYRDRLQMEHIEAELENQYTDDDSDDGPNPHYKSASIGARPEPKKIQSEAQEIELLRPTSTFFEDLSDSAEEEYRDKIHYWQNPRRFQALYKLTPTKDEMFCYRQLMNIVYTDNDPRFQVDATVMQSIYSGMDQLRKDETAVAENDEGWVTTIDNILTVLLFRNIDYAKASNVLGELLLSFTVDVNSTRTVLDFEDRTLLFHMKKAIIAGYYFVPKLVEDRGDTGSMAAASQLATFAIRQRSETGDALNAPANSSGSLMGGSSDLYPSDLVLRDKSAVNGLCGCQCGKPQIKFTFGIRVSDARQMHRRREAYVFKVIANQLSQHMLEGKFLRMFNNYAQRDGAILGIKMADVHTNMLKPHWYGNYNPMRAEMELYGTENPQSAWLSMMSGVPSMAQLGNAPTLGAMTTHRSKKQSDMKKDFMDAFKSEKYVLDERVYIGKWVEQRIVNSLSKFVNQFNPPFLYERPPESVIQNNTEPMSQTSLKPIAMTHKSGGESMTLNMGNPASNDPILSNNTNSDMNNSTMALSGGDGAPSEEELYYGTGDWFLCGLCQLRCSMVSMGLALMTCIFLTGWIDQVLFELPFYDSLEGIITMADQLLAEETFHIGEQVVFDSERFLDLASEVDLSLTQDTYNDISRIYESYFQEVVTEVDLDGVWLVDGDDDNQFYRGMIRLDDSYVIGCNCTITNETIPENEVFVCYQYSLASDNTSLVYTSYSFESKEMYRMMSRMWNRREESVDLETQSYSFYVHQKDLVEPGINIKTEDWDIWLIQFKHYENVDTQVLTVTRSARLNKIYNEELDWDADLKHVIYWISDDSFGDVFVVSTNDGYMDYNIANHTSDNSSINLDSTIWAGSARTTGNKYIEDTSSKLKKWREEGYYNSTQLLDSPSYYTFVQRIEANPIGEGFWIVIVYSKDKVYDRVQDGTLFNLAATVLAGALSLMIGCLSQTVPIIPSEQSLMREKLYESGNTELDASQLKDIAHHFEPARSPKTNESSLSNSGRGRGASTKAPSSPRSNMFSNAIRKMSTFTKSPVMSSTPAPNNVGHSKQESKTTEDIEMEMADLRRTKSKERKVSLNKQNSGRRHSIGTLDKAESLKKTEEALQFAKLHPQSNTDLLTKSKKHRESAAGHYSEDEIETIPLDKFPITRANTIGVPRDRDHHHSTTSRISSKQLYALKREKQRQQLRKRQMEKIQHKLMVQIFSRHQAVWESLWGFWSSRVQAAAFLMVLFLMLLSMYGFRITVRGSIDDVTHNYMKTAIFVAENSMRFTYDRSLLLLQNGRSMIKNYALETGRIDPIADNQTQERVAEFWEPYDTFGIILMNWNQSDYESDNEYEFLSVVVEMNDTTWYMQSVEDNPVDGVCLWMVPEYEYDFDFVSNSNGAAYSDANSTVRDCSTKNAIDAVIGDIDLTGITDQNQRTKLSWSKPYPCMGGYTVCFAGVFRVDFNATLGQFTYMVALVSFDGLKQTGNFIWQGSGLSVMERVIDTEPETFTQNDVDFSVFSVSPILVTDESEKGNTEDTLGLIGATTDSIIKFSDSSYGTGSPHVTLASESDSTTLKRVAEYLSDSGQWTSLGEMKYQPVREIMAYPQIAIFRFETRNSSRQTAHVANALEWTVVVSIDGDIFTGDYEQYAALAFLVLAGAMIIYTYLYATAFRQFEANTRLWEQLFAEYLAILYGFAEEVPEFDGGLDGTLKRPDPKSMGSINSSMASNQDSLVPNPAGPSSLGIPQIVADDANAARQRRGSSMNKGSGRGKGFGSSQGSQIADAQRRATAQAQHRGTIGEDPLPSPRTMSLGNDDEMGNDIDDEWEMFMGWSVLEFMCRNIRESVRTACFQSWFQKSRSLKEVESNVLHSTTIPTKRCDMIDHYHSRALEHIQDAKNGLNIITVVEMEKQTTDRPYMLQVYKFHTSRYWRLILHMVILLQLSLVFFKDLKHDELVRAGGWKDWIYVTDSLCLVVQWLDFAAVILINFYWQDAKSNPLISVEQLRTVCLTRALLNVIIVVDIIGVAGFSFSVCTYIPARPFLLVVINDSLVGAVFAFLMTCKEAKDSVLLYVIIWLISAAFGTLLFRFGEFGDLDNLISFSNFIRAMITSFVFIISGENYGEVVYPTVEVNNKAWLIIYFIVLTLFGSFIVVSLVVSEFQASYKAIHKVEKQRTKFYKRTGFVAAFSLINLDDDNTVDKYEFESFIKYLKKLDNNDDARELLLGLNDFEAHDKDGDGDISIDEFVESLETLYEAPTIMNIYNDDSLTSWLRTAVIEQEAFDQAILLIIGVEMILLMMYGTYPGFRATAMLDLMLGFIVFLNCLDVGVKLSVFGWNYYWHTSKCRVIPMIPLADALAMGLEIPLDVANGLGTAQNTMHGFESSMNNHSPGTNLPMSTRLSAHHEASASTNMSGGMASNGGLSMFSASGRMDTGRTNPDQLVPGPPRKEDQFEKVQREFAHRLDFCIVVVSVCLLLTSRLRDDGFEIGRGSPLRAVMIFPLFRFFSLIKTVRSAVYTIFRVLPRFSSVTALLFILFYVYSTWSTAHIFDALTFLPDNPYRFKFTTFSDSLLTLFQIMVGEGWHDIMYAVMTVKDDFTWAWYFLSFVFLVTLIFTNLFVGLVLSVVEDLEATRKSLKQQSEQDELRNDEEHEDGGDSPGNDGNDDDHHNHKHRMEKSTHHLKENSWVGQLNSAQLHSPMFIGGSNLMNASQLKMGARTKSLRRQYSKSHHNIAGANPPKTPKFAGTTLAQMGTSTSVSVRSAAGKRSSIALKPRSVRDFTSSSRKLD